MQTPRFVSALVDSLPRVLTCSLMLTMPYLIPSDLEDFKDKMTFTILNSQGFKYDHEVLYMIRLFFLLFTLDQHLYIAYIVIMPVPWQTHYDYLHHYYNQEPTLSALWESVIVDTWLQYICLHELQYLQAWWYCNLLGLKQKWCYVLAMWKNEKFQIQFNSIL